MSKCPDMPKKKKSPSRSTWTKRTLHVAHRQLKHKSDLRQMYGPYLFCSFYSPRTKKNKKESKKDGFRESMEAKKADTSKRELRQGHGISNVWIEVWDMHRVHRRICVCIDGHRDNLVPCLLTAKSRSMWILTHAQKLAFLGDAGKGRFGMSGW